MIGKKLGSSRAGDGRLLFIDNIRWVLIVLVICHHAAVTYSHIGSWYYTDGPKPGLIPTFVFATFETFNQAYFMGFLFMLAGYFVPGAYDSKGTWRFLRDRALRLGIPSAFYMFVIHPVTVYWLLRNFEDPSIPPLSRAYLPFIASGRVLRESGPMWFAVALLIFCVVYAIARAAGMKPSAARPIPSHVSVVILIVVIAACSFVVRIYQPIGTSILNMQLCYFTQYVCLFMVGILAYRGNWLRELKHPFGILWMKLACRAGVAGWFVLLLTSGALKGDTASLLGGTHWQSAAFCLWESFFCLGICLGLIVIFRDRFNRQSEFARWMSQNSFSAYLFHTPILICVTLVLRGMPAPVMVKFLVACVMAVPITFAVSGLLRERIPGLRRLL
jgi:glucan biosynthesis protein C